MASLFVELDPWARISVEKRLAQFNIRFVKPYLNLSAFMGTHVWLFDAPVGLPIPQLATIPGIKYTEPDEEHVYMPHFWRHAPNTSGAQSSLPEIMKQIGGTRALANSSGGAGVSILIVDSGVDGNRVPAPWRAGGWTDDPSGNPWEDTTGHGTMVALIALTIAPNAKIFSVRMKSGPNGGLMKESVISAVDSLIPMITPGTQLVMNNSWGTAGCDEEGYW